jgi:hypothetical protein
LQQRLDIAIQDGDQTYPATVVLAIYDGATFDIELTKDGVRYAYNGGAAELVIAGSGRNTAWGLQGSYSAMGANDPRDAGLPLYGRFTAQLSIDCVADTLVSEAISLSD